MTASTPRKTGTRKPGRWRLAVMGMVTAVLIPAMFLGVLELGLRAAGLGHPTAFFVKETIDGETRLHTNHQFTFPYFPQALARAVVPHRMEVTKPPDTYRIFIFGESAANGDPEPAYSFGRHLEILLEERYPGTDFEIVCAAITAINSHVILPIARDITKRDGDLWIVYMGNNEMIGPYGASTVFGSKAPPLPLVRASLAARRTRIGQSMKSLAEGMKREASDPTAWGGINMFTENPLKPDDPGRLTVYRNFRTNLEDILSAGEKAGVPILLSTVGSNLRDCAPFISLNAAGLAESRLAEWNSHYEKGKALEAAESYAEALAQYRLAAAIDDGHAELHFRMGRCHGLSGDLEAAHAALVKARDLDGLVVRADSTINRIIRETAEARGSESVVLADAEAFLAGESPGRLPGRELFYEHVHFTLEGNYRMARFFADRVAGLLPDEITARDSGSWAGPGACQLQLAVTLWDKNRLWTDMAERLSTPPFTFRETNAASLAMCQSNAAAFRERLNPQLDRMVYENALAGNPDDYFLHARFGHYLELNGAVPEAIPHLRWVTEAFPGFEGGHQELGVGLLLDRQFEEAEKSFRRVLEINPQYDKARKALELIENQSP